MYRPSIPDNVTNWKVFDDDQQILDFLSSQDTFKGMEIDEAEHDESLSHVSNIIPKSIANLEKFYDLQDKFKQMTICKTRVHLSTMKLSLWEMNRILASSTLELISLMKKGEPLSSCENNSKTSLHGCMMNSKPLTLE